MGLSYKKTKHVPGKIPSKTTQEIFIEKIINLVEKAQRSSGKYAVLSCDPTHPIYNSVPGYRWQEKGKEGTQILKANTGRRRLTIMGAINLVDRDIIPFVTESNANRELTKIFLKEVKKKYSKAQVITIILDNATYQKSYEVQEYAKDLGIELLYLPPYAPNLSIVERVWKFFKKKTLQNKYYETFEEFFTAVCTFFENWRNYEKELESLLTLNFEILEA